MRQSLSDVIEAGDNSVLADMINTIVLWKIFVFFFKNGNLMLLKQGTILSLPTCLWRREERCFSRWKSDQDDFNIRLGWWFQFLWYCGLCWGWFWYIDLNFYAIVVSQDDTISDRDNDFNIIFNLYDISVSKLCPSAALLCKQGLTKSIIHSSLKKETDKTDCLVLRLFKNHTFQHSRAQWIDWEK